MEPLGLSPEELASELRVPISTLKPVLNGECPVTADLALRLGRFLGGSAEFWLNLQALYDLEEEELRLEPELAQIHTRFPVAA